LNGSWKKGCGKRGRDARRLIGRERKGKGKKGAP